VDVGEAQVKQNEAAVESARLNLEYTSIRSPIDGRAGHRLVDVGNVVTANTTTLLAIERLDPIYADFTVTENDFSNVQHNAARRTLRVEVRPPDEPDKPVVGELTFIDNSVQSSSGTVMLRATAPNGDRRLWPGQFVNVRLVLATLPSAVLVPAAVPQDSAKGPFVYVIKQDSTAELRAVKLGQRQGDLIVVEQGLQAGERVVLNGQAGVLPGAKVRVDTGAAPAQARSASAAGKS
jgi:membrane fusion protein, multidrug efflux system